MTRQLIIFSFFLLATKVFAQQADSIKLYNDTYPVDDDINYKGGLTKMMQKIKTNLQYPQTALSDKISGTVYVYFTIDTLGRSKNLKIIKGVRDDLDKEAIRCVDLLDEWVVGRSKGKKTELNHSLPIKFVLPRH